MPDIRNWLLCSGSSVGEGSYLRFGFPAYTLQCHRRTLEAVLCRARPDKQAAQLQSKF